MSKLKRAQRIAIISRMLVENPSNVFTLSSFSKKFGAAKSTLSEDVALIADAFQKEGIGRVITKQGVLGGVYYCPHFSADKAYDEVLKVSRILNDPRRILPGGFLYWSDILSTPSIVNTLASIIAMEYLNSEADFVLTMETKGIPFAFAVAHQLGVPLLVARRTSKVYEGSSVNINYFSGKGSLEAMSLPKRAAKAGEKALIIDDFISDGGTALGMCTLMKEFNVHILGMAFMLSEDPRKVRHVSGDISLMTLSRSSEAPPYVQPAQWLNERRSKE